MNYDIIGDIHGRLDKLDALLRRLGYREYHGAWRHPDRTAVFVGDLIDRGPHQVATVDRVRRMVDAGAALCVMGNHEFNAIAWTTPDPQIRGEFMRSHAKAGNWSQHRAFLAEVDGKPMHRELIDWFRILPLWLDLGVIRVVHACWNEPYMASIAARLGAASALSEGFVQNAARKGTPAYVAVDAVCKGLEVELPNGHWFTDHSGQRRTSMRVRWWSDRFPTWRSAALVPPGDVDQIPETAMSPDPRIRTYDGPPVFFGHYWFSGPPAVLAPNVACVDYSAAADGPLVAYRWEGEATLSARGFWTHSQ